jgi:hypothetical protein
MTTINRDWWEHLTPKVMHRRRGEVETLLRQWCESEYGAHWLGFARQARGVIRAKPGDFIPVVHFIALGDRPIFIAPQKAVKEGLRTVAPDQFKSSHTLATGEVALGPEIRFDVVQDPVLLAAAARRETSPRLFGVTQPSQVFSAPAHLLIAPTAWPNLRAGCRSSAPIDFTFMPRSNIPPEWIVGHSHLARFTDVLDSYSTYHSPGAPCAHCKPQ